MFLSIKKKLQGILTASALRKKSKAIFDKISNDPEKLASSIKSNDLMQNWEDWHNDVIKDIGKANSRYEQIIALRKAIMEQIEELSSSAPFVTGKYNDDDKKILAKVLYKDQEYENVITSSTYRYMYTKVSWQVLRLISLEFNDASAHDWTEYYEYLSDTYVEHIYERIIKNSKGEDDVFDELEDALINTLKHRRDETKQEILEGSNYEYNLEEIEKEQQQEKEKKSRESANKNEKKKPSAQRQKVFQVVKSKI